MTKELARYSAQATKYKDTIASLTISTPDDLTAATELLSQVNTILDQMTADKETLTAPLTEALKEIRARYAPIELVLKPLKDAIRLKMASYQQKAIETAKAAEQAIIDRIGAGKGYLKPQTAISKLAEIEKPETKLATASGSLSFKPTPTWEIEDMSLVPLDYLVPDEKKINSAMKNKKKVPGIRYYTKQVPINRRG